MSRLNASQNNRQSTGLAEKGAIQNEKKGFWSREQYIRLLVLALVLLITVGIILLRDRLGNLEAYKDYGYLGAFLVSLVSSATVILPAPGMAAVFILGGLLNPVIVGLVAGVGAGLGEITGYMAGYGGKGVFKNRKMYARLEQWMRRRGSIIIVAFAFLPNPLFDMAGFTAGALGFPLWKFLIMCWLGRIPRYIGVSFAGAWGLPWVIDFVQRLGG